MRTLADLIPKLSLFLLSTCSLCISETAAVASDCIASQGNAPEVEACLKANELKQPKIEPLKYPIGFGSSEMTPAQVYLTDEGKWVDTIVQSDGENLNIYRFSVCRGFAICVIGKPQLLASIPKARIYSYTQGLQGSGNTAAVALPGVTASALIMPILAPFQAIATSRNTRIYQYLITEITQDGQLRTWQVTGTSLVPVHRVYENLLPSLTGMNSGESRPKTQIHDIVESGMVRLEKKIAEDKTLLITSNPKKPWCEESLASSYPAIYSRYQSNIEKLNLLGKLIEKAPVTDSVLSSDSKNTDEKWKSYLASNTAMAAWVKANPLPAQKLKKCSP